MKDTLSYENSFIFDRNWARINPKNQITVSVDQAKQFLKLLIEDHQKLKKINEATPQEDNDAKIMDKIESFLFKYIQQKELALAAKRELPILQKTPYRLSLNDCLEVWRWLMEDSTSYKTKVVSYDQSLEVNEFGVGNNFEVIEIKKSVDYSSKNKKVFSQLSLEEQESVLKKSLEMVHLYYHQFKIIFSHYCKFTIENEHKRTNTFDDVSQALQKLTINRFMLFCREFDIIKTLEFKRKTEQNPTMSKEFLMKAFKKNAHLQKYLSFDSFLMTLVNISIKIHENFDPRSYMHMELFLNNLKVKYYEEFVNKLESLSIKYSPTQFYNCYRHIFNKQAIKKKKATKKTIFNNSYFKQETNYDLINNQSMPPKQSEIPSRIIKSHQSVPNLLAADYYESETRMKKASKTLQRRKVSVPVLPSLEENRFYKPTEHNHHLNSYKSHLSKIGDTSSVFKNRITGYANINNLKAKGFHMHQNPEAISKEDFHHLIAKKKLNLHEDPLRQQLQMVLSVGESGNGKLQTSEQVQMLESKIFTNPSFFKEHLIQKMGVKEQSSVQFQQQQKIPTITASKLLKKEEKRQALESLKQKIDVEEDDELLSKHLIAEQAKQRQLSKPSNARKALD